MLIKELAKQLRLPHIREHYESYVKEGRELAIDYKEFLENILKNELEQRNINSTQTKIRNAKFPFKKYIEDFDKSKYPNGLMPKFKALETLDFIKNNENIILIGTPGSGKTHYATALGMKACLENKTVLFSSVPNLVIEMKEALSQNQFCNYKKKFNRYDLVILDELGYISFDKNGCEILFNLISQRNEKGSMIITSNLVFERWTEIFNDTMLTGAIVDRLTHKAHIMDLSRETSFRFEETLEWLNKTENKEGRADG